MIKAFSYVFLSLFLLSCASVDRETSKQLRSMVMAKDFDSAINLLGTSPLAQNEKTQLLYYFELGLINHYKGDFTQSNIALLKAKELIDELYTTRVSGKLTSVLSNDNADFYYGEKYEASLVYFYLSLNFYMQATLSADPSEKKVLLRQAKSEITGWDSFLTEIKIERIGKAVFKEDLLAKTFGAFVHEAQGTREDTQIALQLYKDANSVLFKNYNLFPTYNTSYKNFKDNFSNLANLPLKEVEGKYVLETEHSQSLKDFLALKILSLTKKFTPQEYKSMVTQLKPSSAVLENLKQEGGNVTFLIQDGLIVEKLARKYEYPLSLNSSIASGLTFGLGNAISFELPYVGAAPILENARLEALEPSGKVVSHSSLTIVAPLAELAEQAINEHSSSVAAKTGARVAAKHIAAILGAQAAYNASKNEHPAMAFLLATAAHSAAVAAIRESEKADLRYWSTLPSNIRMGNLTLPNGIYKFRAVFGQEGSHDYRIIELGEQSVEKGTLKFVMDNKNHHQRARELASIDQPVFVKAQEISQEPISAAVATSAPEAPRAHRSGCMKDTECPQGSVCATVGGEFPGSCAGTGFFGGIGRSLSGDSGKNNDCSSDKDCPDGKVCATVRGEYPGWCAN